MRTLKRGTLPVLMLVVVVAWALTAVALLTGILVTAQRIDNRVEVINSEVKPINQDLDNVRLALETQRIADEINRAAKPLGGQFEQITLIGDGIEASSGSILERAKAINANAKSINSTVTSINSTVGEIGSSVGSIGSSIASVNAAAGSINTSVDQISGSFVGILGEVRSINQDPENLDVGGINDRADVATAISQEIKNDTAEILNLADEINENAEAIEGSILLLRDLDLLNQQAATMLPAPAPGPPVPGANQSPLPEVPAVPALPLPELVPALPTQELPLPQGGGVLPAPGLLQSSGSDTGNLLGGALR